MSADLMDLVNQLRSTLGTLEVALGAIADALVWTGEDGRIQWCNAAFDKLVNRPHILVLNQHLHDLLPLIQAGRPVAVASYPNARMLIGDYAVTEYEFQPDAGAKRLVLEISGNCADVAATTPSTVGCGQSTVLVIRDITQAKQAAAEYQQSEQQRQRFYTLMQATLESMDDAVLVLTNDRKAPIYNQKFLEMWSIPERLMQPGHEDQRIQFLMERTRDPEAFLARVWELFRDRPTETALDLIEMKDGRILERLAQPLWHDTQTLGRVWTYRDVTETVQTEQALRERETKFRSLVENASDIIFAIDVTGTVFYISPNVQTIMGFSPTEMEGRLFTPFVHPDDVHRCMAAIDQVITNQQGFSNLEYRARSKDGSWRWYVTSLATPQAMSGNQLIVGVARDITDVKQTEEALRQSELRFQAIFENASVGTTLAGTDGSILQVNPAWVNALGYSEAEFYTMKFTEYTHPDDVALDAALTQDIFNRVRDSFQLEKRYIRKDGSVFWGRLTVSPIRDANGNTLFTLALMEDINDRKRAEKALRQSESRYRALVTATAQSIFTTNAAGEVVDDIPLWRSLTGQNEAEAKGFGWLESVHPDDREPTMQAWLESLKTGNLYEVEQRVRDGAGNYRLFSVRAVPVLDDQGKIREWVGTQTDITDRKQAEEALRQAEEKYRSIFENSVEGIFQTTPDGRYLSVNPTMARMHGYASPEEMMANLTDLDSQLYVQPHRRQEFKQILEQYGQVFEFESEIYCRDGSTVWESENARAVRDDQGVLLYYEGTCSNISARKRAEDALRKSELKYRNIFENSQVGIGRIRLEDGLFLDVNQRYVEMMGFASTTDLIGKRFTTEFYADPDDRHKILAELHQHGEVRNFEEQLRRPDGATVWGLLSLRPNPEEDCLDFVLVDISDRKRLEEELRQSQQFLDNIVDNIPLAVFVKDVNHDFRYVLSNKSAVDILGFTKAMVMGRNDYDLVPKDQADAYRTEDLATLAQGSLLEFPEQWKHVHADSDECIALQYWKLPLFDDQGNATHLLAICENITERKQAEEALQQSESRFRALYESTTIAVLLGEGDVLSCNQATEQLFGYPRHELAHKHLADLSPPLQPDGQDSLVLANQHLAIAYEQGRHRFEWMHRRANGTDFPAEVQLTVFEANGSKLLQAAIQDLTERKQAEAVLLRRAQVEQLLSSVSRQFIDQSIDTAVAFTLNAISEFLGTERSCIFEYSQQQQQFRLMHEWCAAAVEPMPEAAKESSTELFPWFYNQILNGQPVQIPRVAELPLEAIAEKTVFQRLQIQSIVAVPMLHSGKVVGFIGSDVVHRTKTWSQEEINLMQLVGELIAIGQVRQEAEEKFTKAFRASPSPIAITTLPDRRFLDVNSSFLRLSGCSLDQIIDHTADELNLGAAQDVYEDAIQQMRETGSLHNQEVPFRTQSGEIRTVLLSIETIELAGTPCVLNIVNDITERKRLENELISLVSHELRTPMTSLLGALDLLGSGQLGTLTAQGQQVLNIATTNTERLTRLVNDILDLERMRSGKVTMQKVKCNVADLLTQAAESMQAMADNAQVTLMTEPLSINLLADPDRMLQALTNLLSNAIKFSETGSTVWLKAHKQDRTSTVIITVIDQGRGIPTDKLHIIFDRFQQVDASDSRKKGGTGLGLAICRNIVEQHEGKIWAESMLGQGSTFYITLPLLF